MKSLFYYLFGLLTAFILVLSIFNNYAELFLDEYYIDILYTDAKFIWWSINTGITTLFIFCVLIFVYMLGKETNCEKKESLLTNKEKENE